MNISTGFIIKIKKKSFKKRKKNNYGSWAVIVLKIVKMGNNAT